MSLSMRKGRPPNKPKQCLRCGTDLSKCFQLIFDNTGTELELKKLLLLCFQLDVKQDKRKFQALCESCLNSLIEVFDVMQRNIESEPGPSTSDIAIEPIKVENEFEEDTENNLDDVDDYKSEHVLILSGSSNLNEVKEEDDSSQCTLYESYGMNEEQGTDGNSEHDNHEMYQNIDYLEEHDQEIDLIEYKCKVLRSTFMDLMFPEEINCRLCSQGVTQHAEIIRHTSEIHCAEESTYPCIIDNVCETFKSIKALTFHLVFKHYDLESLTIYSQCCECNKTFTDFSSYNKHSCYNGEKLSRSLTDCTVCNRSFKSNKRYRFHQQFHLNKRRPKACLICDIMYRDEDEFYEHIMYNHEKNLGFVCIRCDRVFLTEENLKFHEGIHNVNRKFSCDICNKSYFYNQLLKDHIISAHGKSTYECHLCGKILIKRTLLNKHILSHAKREMVSIKSCSDCGFIAEDDELAKKHVEEYHDVDNAQFLEQTIEISYCCEYCEMAYDSIENMFTHRDSHEKKDYYCDLCPLSYNQYKKLKTHKLTHADYVDKRKTFPVMRHYVCDFPGCKASYLQWTSLKSHKRHKHDNKEQKCPKCLQTFYNDDKYKDHLKSAHNGDAFECHFCVKTFATKMALAVHTARKHNTNRFNCTMCQTSYASQEHLKKHINSTHKIFTCEICGKVLKNYKNYQVHDRMVHKQEKRFNCKYCDKGYFNNCDKNDHEQSVHEKVKRYKCDLCPFTAIYKETITIHMRKHKNESPYVCDLCGKGFRRRYGLELHKRRHLEIKNFKCPHDDCGSSYPNQGILNAHLRTKHSENGIPKRPTRKRRFLADFRFRDNVPLTDTFIDDDDGLDEGVIGEPANDEKEHEGTDEGVKENPPCVEYEVVETEEHPAVIVQKNERDHDYIVKIDEERIYGNVIEEFEVMADG